MATKDYSIGLQPKNSYNGYGHDFYLSGNLMDDGDTQFWLNLKRHDCENYFRIEFNRDGIGMLHSMLDEILQACPLQDVPNPLQDPDGDDIGVDNPDDMTESIHFKCKHLEDEVKRLDLRMNALVRQFVSLTEPKEDEME